MNLGNRFERFCYKHRDKGIPNLMLYIVIGSAIIYLLSMFNGGIYLTGLLRFDKAKILEGQVWRLFTYIFTEASDSGSILSLLFLYFFYNLGRYTELSMGTFKFNLFYFSGVVLMSAFGMIFAPTQPVAYIGYYYVYAQMAFYLHLSILLMFAATNPDSQFYIFFIIPIKAWVMGLIYLVLVSSMIFNLSYPVNFFPHNLFPLIGLLNFLLFAGRDVLNLFPFLKNRRPRVKKQRQATGPITYTPNASKQQTANYTHRCTICGRTDVSNPELEFRYCSRCNGYFCYCEDHINNHNHIQ